MKGFTGIAFPFKFGGRGGVETSTTSPQDFQHINESIKQILLTHIGERHFEVDFGSEVPKQLFKSFDDELELEVTKYYITEALNKWEDRIEVLDVTLEPLENGYEGTCVLATIHYRVITYMAEGTFAMELNSLQ